MGGKLEPGNLFIAVSYLILLYTQLRSLREREELTVEII